MNQKTIIKQNQICSNTFAISFLKKGIGVKYDEIFNLIILRIVIMHVQWKLYCLIIYRKKDNEYLFPKKNWYLCVLIFLLCVLILQFLGEMNFINSNFNREVTKIQILSKNYLFDGINKRLEPKYLIFTLLNYSNYNFKINQFNFSNLQKCCERIVFLQK